MKLLITSATEFETAQAREAGVSAEFHVSGVGMLATAFSLTQRLLQNPPDLVIQAGIAGAIDGEDLNKVVVVGSEFLGDLGVEEDGEFRDLFDMGLLSDAKPPFSGKCLPNPWLREFNRLQLPVVRAITVNEITTSEFRIGQLARKYEPEIESMEGAALHYVCLSLRIPFLQIRAISNLVGDRDKSRWDIPGALRRLNGTLIEYLRLL